MYRIIGASLLINNHYLHLNCFILSAVIYRILNKSSSIKKLIKSDRLINNILYHYKIIIKNQ